MNPKLLKFIKALKVEMKDWGDIDPYLFAVLIAQEENAPLDGPTDESEDATALGEAFKKAWLKVEPPISKKPKSARRGAP